MDGGGRRLRELFSLGRGSLARASARSTRPCAKPRIAFWDYLGARLDVAKGPGGPILAHSCPAPLRRRLTADTFAPITRIPLSYCFCGNLHAPSLVLIRKDEYSRRKDEYFRPISYVGRTGHHGRTILGALNAFGSDGASAQFGPSSPRGRVVDFGVAANPHAPEPVMQIQQKTLRSREAAPRAARPWR